MAMTKAEFLKCVAIQKEIFDELYVQKEQGKGLSTNDFSDEFKNKLAEITDETITPEEIRAIIMGNGND